MALTEKQRIERCNYIGGSDAATICGVNPYGNIIELWQEKLGLKEIDDISDKPQIRAGNYLEPVVAQWFQDDTDILVEIHPDTFYHKDHAFMAANVDRLITGKQAGLECKTAGYSNGWGEIGENIIPDYYLCQVAHYTAVLDYERWYIAVLIGGNDFRWYVYERNQKLEDMILAKEKAFWECVKTETPPEPRTPEEVISLYSQATEEEPLIVNDEIEQAIHLLNGNKELMKTAELQVKIQETKIKSFMKNHDVLHGRNGKPLATWKNSKAPIRFDAKSFSSENQELYEKYLKQGNPSRRFSIK